MNEEFNKVLDLSADEIMHACITLEDIGRKIIPDPDGGGWFGNEYFTPSSCFHCACFIKKVNGFMFNRPSLYKVAYENYMKCCK